MHSALGTAAALPSEGSLAKRQKDRSLETVNRCCEEGEKAILVTVRVWPLSGTPTALQVLGDHRRMVAYSGVVD